MLATLRISVIMILVMTILTAVLYPGVVTLAARLFFSDRAEGSLVMVNGKAAGSELIGQSFTDPKYFWGRPSATGPFPYNPGASSGSNLGPTNQVLLDQVKARVAALQAADSGNHAPVPVDLVTASGSGLDPEISVGAALYQAPRVGRVRGIPLDTVKLLIGSATRHPDLGFLGTPRVNVLALNILLDARERGKQ